jgi:FAD/FMN-containing dehydrogenase
MPQVEDASGFAGYADDLVSPRSESELQEAIRRAAHGKIPFTVLGGRTGVTGAGVPDGGLAISLEHFQRLDVRQGGATVGAGVVLRDLQAAASATGQFYPPDPTENSACIGGTIATNASGSRSFGYGDTRRHVQRLRVASATGEIREFRRGETIDFPLPELPLVRTTKRTAGYPLHPGMDWVDLFVGSEGTLGIVIEADLKLLPAPAALLTGVVFFPSDDLALDFVGGSWSRYLRMLEYLDRPSLELLRGQYPEVPNQAAAALLIEQELKNEEDPAVDFWLSRLEIAGAILEASWFATSAADRERFRKFRHALPELVNDLVRRNGFLKMGSDCAVPLERNREMLAYYRQRLEREFPGQYVIFGHIGDAHLHPNVLPHDNGEAERARDLMNEFAREAVRLGGTVSAEHGLGKRKRHLLELQYTPEQLAAMRDVKRRLDPEWLLGRGTLFEIPV